MRITFISDTHTKHRNIEQDLPGGDLIIHAGDIMNSGYDSNDVGDFCEWYDGLSQYNAQVFIAGNHDRMFENLPEAAMQIVDSYKWITYLQDSSMVYTTEDLKESCKIYGTPWQPEFCNWAFNLPRDGKELELKWAAIPPFTDILVTHGPAWGYRDMVMGQHTHLGCGLLADRIHQIKPKIHVCGHIHSGHGYYFDGNTHFINASVLGERYSYDYQPMTADWNPTTNEIIWL
jgi:hypothetical protein